MELGNRYILFGGDYYYPNGGIGDLIDQAFSPSQLTLPKEEGEFLDWWHVYDVQTRTIVACSESQPYWNYWVKALYPEEDNLPIFDTFQKFIDSHKRIKK